MGSRYIRASNMSFTHRLTHRTSIHAILHVSYFLTVQMVRNRPLCTGVDLLHRLEVAYFRKTTVLRDQRRKRRSY